jgi:hypothetical protein
MTEQKLEQVKKILTLYTSRRERDKVARQIDALYQQPKEQPEMKVCPECVGTGEDTQTMGNTNCPNCNGTGKVPKPLEICPECHGGKCNCCGETQIKFLVIDHINNDGAQERKITGMNTMVLWKRLIKEGFPRDKYQLLCSNCNEGKRRNHGICPHQQS